MNLLEVRKSRKVGCATGYPGHHNPTRTSHVAQEINLKSALGGLIAHSVGPDTCTSIIREWNYFLKLVDEAS